MHWPRGVELKCPPKCSSILKQSSFTHTAREEKSYILLIRPERGRGAMSRPPEESSGSAVLMALGSMQSAAAW
jgi:hypothetical protein